MLTLDTLNLATSFDSVWVDFLVVGAYAIARHQTPRFLDDEADQSLETSGD